MAWSQASCCGSSLTKGGDGFVRGVVACDTESGREFELAAKVDLVLDRIHQTIQIRAQHGGVQSERRNAFRIAAQSLEFVDQGR